MAFFGVEIKPGKPYTHTYDKERGRLRISQAALGTGTSTKRSSLQCNVGNKSPILLCNLIPNVSETFNLKLEFEEDEEVTFSVLGQTSVHLSGYYLGGAMNGDEFDSHGEDIPGSESESSGSYDEEDESDSEFMDEDDMDMFPPSKRKSSVIIEEIEDEETPNEKAEEKNQQNKTDCAKKKKHAETSNDSAESEDEDGFTISSSSTPSAKTHQNMVDKDKKSIQTKSNKKKSPIEAGKCEKDNDVKEKIATDNSDTKVKKKKKSKKGKIAEAIADVSAEKTVDIEKNDTDSNIDKKHNEVTDSAPVKETSGKEKKNKKKRAKDDKDSNVDGEKVVDIAKKIKKENAKDLTSSLEQGKHIKASKSELKTQTLADGLVIDDLVMGKSDGKKAVPGKKVSVNYIGKLLKTGKIFDSNVGQRPFQFRLGKGEVIRGWDVGVNGMKVGDKRRLTIPPSYGYGSRNMGPIPANSWLTFDVELVSVQ